jgi:hypothetical protein
MGSRQWAMGGRKGGGGREDLTAPGTASKGTRHPAKKRGGSGEVRRGGRERGGRREEGEWGNKRKTPSVCEGAATSPGARGGREE